MEMEHPRRRTSYLLTVAVLAALVYVQLDSWIVSRKGLRLSNIRRILAGAGEESDPFAHLPEDGPCIAILVTNKAKDVEELKRALRSLKFLQGDSGETPAPVLIFNEGNLSNEQKKAIRDTTHRTVAFPEVNFNSFPEGFNPDSEEVKFHVKGRSDWGYYHMIRFWVSTIWKHPILERFSTVMRIDSDSCFTAENSFLPYFKHPNMVYHSQYVGYEDGKEFVTGLFDFAEEWMEEEGLYPSNPMLWQFAKNLWETESTLPLFNTNFEVTRKAWMQHRDVTKWHNALTDSAPFGIYKYRWGDAVMRFMTAAMFSPNYRIDTSAPEGYAHKLGCSEADASAPDKTV